MRVNQYSGVTTPAADAVFLLDSQTAGTKTITMPNLRKQIVNTTTSDPGENSNSSLPNGSILVVYE